MEVEGEGEGAMGHGCIGDELASAVSLGTLDHSPIK